MIKYFNYKTDEKNDIYSVDMIRFNFKLNVTYDCFNKFIYKYLNKDNFQISFYICHSVGYHYLYNIKILSNDYTCSFVLGVGLNFSSQSNIGFIEYNPNKCCIMELFNTFYNDFLTYLRELKLVRYDLAIDFCLPRSLLTLSCNRLNRKQEKKGYEERFCFKQICY